MANKLILRESGTRAVLTLVGGEHEMQPTQAQFVTDTKRYMFRDMDDAYHDILDLDPTMTTAQGHIPFIGADTYRVAVDDYMKYDVDDHTLRLVNNDGLPQISLESPVYSLPNNATTFKSAGSACEIEPPPNFGVVRIESDSVTTRDRIRDMFQIYNKSDEDISIGFGAAFTITLENNHHATPMEAARIEAVYTGISDPDEIELRFYVGVDEVSPGPSFEQKMLTLTKDNVIGYGPLKITSRATDDLITPQAILENIDLSVVADQEIGSFIVSAGEDSAKNVASISVFAKENWTDTSSPTRMIFYTTPTGSVENVLALTIDSDGNIGVGIEAPVNKQHNHVSDSGINYLQFTNTTTGITVGDGVRVGITDNEEAIFWNQEDTNMRFATNGQERILIAADGTITMASLAGVGTRNVVVDANGVLSAP